MMKAIFLLGACIGLSSPVHLWTAQVGYQRTHNPRQTENKVWIRNRLTLDVKVNGSNFGFEKIHKELADTVHKDRTQLEEQFKKKAVDAYLDATGQQRKNVDQASIFARLVEEGTLSEVRGNMAAAKLSVVVEGKALPQYSDVKHEGRGTSSFTTLRVPSVYYPPDGSNQWEGSFDYNAISYQKREFGEHKKALFRRLGVNQGGIALDDYEAYRDTELQILCRLFVGDKPQFWERILDLIGDEPLEKVRLITLHIHSEQAPCGLCSALLTELSKQMNGARYRSGDFNQFMDKLKKEEEVEIEKRTEVVKDITLPRKTTYLKGSIIKFEKTTANLTEEQSYNKGTKIKKGSTLVYKERKVETKSLKDNIDQGKTKFLIEISSDEPDGNCALAASMDKKTLLQKLFGGAPTVITDGALSEASEDCSLCPPNVIWRSFNPYPISEAEAEVDATINQLKARLEELNQPLPAPAAPQPEPQAGDQQTSTPASQQKQDPHAHQES